MSMTTVAKPTSNAEWQCRSAMAISHPFRHGAVACRNLLFYLEGLAHQCDAAENSKNPDFLRPAYSSLFQLVFLRLCGTPSHELIARSGAVSRCVPRVEAHKFFLPDHPPEYYSHCISS
jgi:hypothetical protein